MSIDPNSTDHHLPTSSVEESLQKILNSPRFRDALQLQLLLKFIVENSINGHDDALKERIIGMSVFGRKADYETADDPIVRSRVGQLRKRLEQYYQSEEAMGCAVKITIPSGTYKPTFILLPQAHAENHRISDEKMPQLAATPSAEETAKSLPPPSNPRSARKSRLLVWGITGAAFCILLLFAWKQIAKLQANELDLFWKPIFGANKTVLICNGTISAFRPSANFWSKTLPQLKPGDLERPESKRTVPPLTKGEVLTSDDFTIIPDGFLTPGDLVATMSVTKLLDARHQSYSLRTGDNLPLVDLQAAPAVLIGAFNNSWTMDLTQNLPFFFDRGHNIRERGGQRRVWSSLGWPDDTAVDDYAIVARIMDSKANQPVIVLAGKRNCGTEAAAEFATDPTQLKKLHTLSRDDLERSSLELVLHVSLDHCKPTSMDVVALKTW